MKKKCYFVPLTEASAWGAFALKARLELFGLCSCCLSLQGIKAHADTNLVGRIK